MSFWDDYCSGIDFQNYDQNTYSFIEANDTVVPFGIKWKYTPVLNGNTCNCHRWYIYRSTDLNSVYSNNILEIYCGVNITSGQSYTMTWFFSEDNYDGEWAWFGVKQRSAKENLISNGITPGHFCPIKQKVEYTHLASNAVGNKLAIFFKDRFFAKLNFPINNVPLIDTRCGRNTSARIRCIMIDSEEELIDVEVYSCRDQP